MSDYHANDLKINVQIPNVPRFGVVESPGTEIKRRVSLFYVLYRAAIRPRPEIGWSKSQKKKSKRKSNGESKNMKKGKEIYVTCGRPGRRGTIKKMKNKGANKQMNKTSKDIIWTRRRNENTPKGEQEKEKKNWL